MTNKDAEYFFQKKNVFLDKDYRRRPTYQISIERLRIILMFFMCINLMGAPTGYSGYIEIISGFAPIAFFIISGYLVLAPTVDQESRIKATIQRTLLVFVILIVCYMVVNYFFYKQLDINMFSVFKSKRVWFEFLVLNVWPFNIGTSIWYVHALLYAYIIILIMKKLNLLDYDLVFILIGLVLCVIGGEFAGIFKFNILGYNCFPGCFINRALPYVLLGGFIRKHMVNIHEVSNMYWIVGIFIGAGLVFLEIYELNLFGVSGYYGHLIGMGVIAISACMLAFNDDYCPTQLEYDLNISRWHINTIYYTAHPVGVLIALFITTVDPQNFYGLSKWIGVITFGICSLIAITVSVIQNIFKQRKQKIEEDSFDSQE